jgi:hypothetical protein
MIELKNKWRDIFMRYNDALISIILEDIFTLISNKRFTDKHINLLVENIEEVFYYNDIKHTKKIIKIVRDLLKELEDDCLELELYETLQNIKNYKEKLNI